MKLITGTFLASLLMAGKTLAVDACQQRQQLSGGRTIYNKNETGRGNGNYRYEIWRDGNGGELTLYPKDACFKASWNNAGDYLGRVGLVWDQYINYKNAGGDIIANYAYKKTGDDGGTYSYIGIYGWMDNPQIEYYIVDDWLHNRGAPGGSWMGSQKGTINVDGGTYKVWSGTRTGASKWGESTFTQIFSVRTTQRQCGQINVSEHFRQWEKLGLRLGSVMEAQILAESGGGSGSVDFTYAAVEIGKGGSNNASYNGGQQNSWNQQGGQQQQSASSYPKGTGMQYYSQCKNPKQWAMTFDDGPTQFADAVLDYLKEKGVHATFFVLGNMYMQQSDPNWSRIIKRMYNEGHVVGSHTYSHKDLTTISYQEIRNEMKQLEDAVYAAIGKKPAFMRPPYGSGNGNQNVIKALGDAGYHAAITWNLDSGDWNNKDVNYARQVFSGANGQGSISLNHLQYNGSTKDSILALIKAEMDVMLQKGYKMVTMEECLGMSAYQ